MLLDLNKAESDFLIAVSQGHVFETSETIKAEVIRALMLGVALPGRGETVPTPCGVRLKGATIDGAINLNNGRGYPEKIMPGLALEHCVIPDGIDVSYAELGKLSIESSRIAWVRAIRTIFHGEVIAKDIGPVTGDETPQCYLDFRGAHIEGDMLLNRSVLREPMNLNEADRRQYAFSLRNAFINGTVYFRQVDCGGTINLSMALIEGNFTARGSQIRPKPCKEAILAEDARIKGGLLLRRVKRTGQGFTAYGRINLKRAIIGGAVFDQAHIIDGSYDPESEADDVVSTIELEDAVIEGGLYFRDGFSLEGNLGMVNATVRTDVDLSGAKVRDGIVATAAKIGCAFNLNHAHTSENTWTILSDVVVGTVLSVKCLDSHLDLRRASVKTYDDGCTIPEQRKLRLDGFLYERLESVGKGRKGLFDRFFNTIRLDWLERQEGYRFNDGLLSVLFYALTSRSRLRADKDAYRPQPFIQLGRVLEAHGYDNDARKIWRITEWMEWKNEKRVTVRFMMFAFGSCFGFGYSPLRAVLTTLLFFGVGIGGYLGASNLDLLVYDPTPIQSAIGSTGKLAYLNESKTSETPMRCDIDPVVYITDLMVPLVELHKTEKCDIREDLKTIPLDWPTSAVALIRDRASWLPAQWMTSHYQLNVAFLGRFLHTLYALLGWLITSLAILTFSGLLRQKSRAQ